MSNPIIPNSYFPPTHQNSGLTHNKSRFYKKKAPDSFILTDGVFDVGTDTYIVEYTYDALGRRIRKIDYYPDPDAVTMYYYNDKWQVLLEYNDSDIMQKSFFYGNYIDEVLYMYSATGGAYFYVHNNLHSPAALLDSSGAVVERYEYNAYGKAAIYDSNFTLRSSSLHNNQYYFTGRRLDILDNGSYEIMYYRNRYYDTDTGRFLQHDPLGINPADGYANMFNVFMQYKDGLNVYGYVNSSPVNMLDPYGLTSAWKNAVGYLYDAAVSWAISQLRSISYNVDGTGCGRTVEASFSRKKSRHLSIHRKTMKVEVEYESRYVSLSKKSCTSKFSPIVVTIPTPTYRPGSSPSVKAEAEFAADDISTDLSASFKWYNNSIFDFGVNYSVESESEVVFRKWDPLCCCKEYEIELDISQEGNINYMPATVIAVEAVIYVAWPTIKASGPAILKVLKSGSQYLKSPPKLNPV